MALFCSMMEEHQNNLRKIISLLGVMKSTRSFKRMLRFLVGTCGLYEIRLEQGQKMRSSLFRLRPCKLFLKMGMQPLAKLVHTAMLVNFSRKVHKEKEARTSLTRLPRSISSEFKRETSKTNNKQNLTQIVRHKFLKCITNLIQLHLISRLRILLLLVARIPKE